MTAYDFEYDGIRLSDIGYTICEFGTIGQEAFANGSEITFNTTSTLNGTKWELASYQYSECITATFDICKNGCDFQSMEITVPEFRHLMRWLNRKRNHKLRIIGDEWAGLWWEGTFNVSRIEYGDKIIGAEVTFISNRPFAQMEEIEHTFINNVGAWEFTIKDYSDEEGFIYPHMEITMYAAGDLTIHSNIEDRDTYIGNVKNTELITFDYPIITSRAGDHVKDDFNWNFPRIANTFDERENIFTVSLPCYIYLSYCPIAKMGL